MNLFYWADLAGTGYDMVAHAVTLAKARAAAKKSLKGVADPQDIPAMERDIDREPMGHFHYEAAIPIFTEHDAVESRVARSKLASMAKQMRERASFDDADPSLVSLLNAWAEELESGMGPNWDGSVAAVPDPQGDVARPTRAEENGSLRRDPGEREEG